MSGWDDAGELVAEGIDWVVDKHHDKLYDAGERNIHWTGDKIRKARRQPTLYDKKGRPLPAKDQPNQQQPQQQDQQDQRDQEQQQRSPQGNSLTDQYGQPTNQFSSRRYSDEDDEDFRARNLARQGAPPSDFSRPGTGRSVQPANGYEASRGIDGAMGDNGYGPPEYGRDPRGSSGYDDGYEGGDADDYRRAYKPDRPQPYDPSRYAPHAGYAAGAATQYAPQGGQRYLPPPPATPRAYDDPYDDYDSDDSYDRRRRAHKSKSETGLRRYNSRGSSRGGRSERSGRDRDADDDEEEGERGHHHDEEKKGPQHKTAATIAGALIGGLAGYQISNRKGKPESFHTIAGAIVGAVGAREADKWYEGRREEKKEHEKRHREERDEEKEDRYNDRNDRYQF